MKFIEIHFGNKIKVFQSDMGTKYTNQKFSGKLASLGIRKFSSPHTLAQNGHAERRPKNLMELGLAMPFHANVRFEVLTSSIFLINQLPSKACL